MVTNCKLQLFKKCNLHFGRVYIIDIKCIILFKFIYYYILIWEYLEYIWNEKYEKTNHIKPSGMVARGNANEKMQVNQDAEGSINSGIFMYFPMKVEPTNSQLTCFLIVLVVGYVV